MGKSRPKEELNIPVMVFCIIGTVLTVLGFLLIKNNDMGLIFIIGAPLQILVILWYLFINETTKIKWQLKLRKKEKQNKKNDGN